LSLGANASAQVYEACAIRSGATSNPFINVTGASVNNQVTFINTTVQFAAAAAFLSCGQGFFTWKNTASAITGATLPTTLFKVNVNRSCIALIEGVDLSALGSGKTLVSGEATPQQFVFKDCRLGASVTVSGTPTAPSSMRTDLIRGDSSGTNYRTERYRYEGTQTAETTIVRTGGASDGTTSLTWNLTTTANSKWAVPFEAIPISIWNDSTSAITTLTIYGTTTGGGVPNDDDIWIDVEYLGAAGNPQGSFKTSTKADTLAAAAATNNSADGSTWGGSGAGNGFKIVCPSFTPAQKGPINIM
jgi:hypothetical protein